MMPSIGKNIRLIAAVAMNIGSISSLALALAASLRVLPRPRWSIYPSIVMMESSTIIPSTTIRAARVTVFRSRPTRYITATATAVHTGTPELAMRADLSGKSISITKITTSMEMTRSRRKENTESSTTFGWLVIWLTLTLSGSSARNASRVAPSSFPKATILFSGSISTEMIMVPWPL